MGSDAHTRIRRALLSLDYALILAGYYVIHNTWIQPSPAFGVDDWFIVMAVLTPGLYLLDVQTDGGFIDAHTRFMSLFDSPNRIGGGND